MGDNDFPTMMGNQALGFLQAYLLGEEKYSQMGTDIPSRNIETKYAQERGGPLVSEQLISGSPSFDLRYPKIPGRNLEGIPNADNPAVHDILRRRLLRNPDGGEELPGFLKKA